MGSKKDDIMNKIGPDVVELSGYVSDRLTAGSGQFDNEELSAVRELSVQAMKNAEATAPDSERVNIGARRQASNYIAGMEEQYNAVMELKGMPAQKLFDDATKADLGQDYQDAARHGKAALLEKGLATPAEVMIIEKSERDDSKPISFEQSVIAEEWMKSAAAEVKSVTEKLEADLRENPDSKTYDIDMSGMADAAVNLYDSMDNVEGAGMPISESTWKDVQRTVPDSGRQESHAHDAMGLSESAREEGRNFLRADQDAVNRYVRGEIGAIMSSVEEVESGSHGDLDADWQVENAMDDAHEATVDLYDKMGMIAENYGKQVNASGNPAPDDFLEAKTIKVMNGNEYGPSYDEYVVEKNAPSVQPQTAQEPIVSRDTSDIDRAMDDIRETAGPSVENEY